MEPAVQEPVGEDPLSHHVDEVEALAREEPPGVAAVDTPVDVKQEKPQAQCHPIDASLIYGSEFHTSTDVCHEAPLFTLPEHPEMDEKLNILLKRIESKICLKLVLVTSVCRRSRRRCLVPEVPIGSKSGVSAPHLGSEGRRLGALPSCGTDPGSVP